MLAVQVADLTQHLSKASHLNMLLVLTLQPDCQALRNSTHVRKATVIWSPLQYTQPSIERTPANVYNRRVSLKVPRDNNSLNKASRLQHNFKQETTHDCLYFSTKWQT